MRERGVYFTSSTSGEAVRSWAPGKGRWSCSSKTPRAGEGSQEVGSVSALSHWLGPTSVGADSAFSRTCLRREAGVLGAPGCTWALRSWRGAFRKPGPRASRAPTPPEDCGGNAQSGDAAAAPALGGRAESRKGLDSGCSLGCR